MAYNFSLRARKLAWSFSEAKDVSPTRGIRRVGTDSTLNDEDNDIVVSDSITRVSDTEDVGKLISTLKKDGCVILEDFTHLQTLQKANEEAKTWLKARDSQKAEDLIPLIKHSPTIRNDLLANDVYQDLCDEFLTVRTTRWKNDRLATEIRQPGLSSVVTRRLQAIGFESDVARHDAAMGIKHEQTDKYRVGRDCMLGLIVPGSENLRLNAVLGSHLFGNSTPNFDNMVETELKVGEALIVLGSMYHYVAAQTERQANAEAALVHTMWSCSDVYRPEDELLNKISSSEIQTYPDVIQGRLR